MDEVEPCAASLQTSISGMELILRLDDGDGNVGLVVEDVVGPLALASAGQLAAHGDAALGEADFLANLCHLVPPGLAQGRGDELGADVALAETFLVHADQFTTCTGILTRSPHTSPTDGIREDVAGVQR